MTHGVSRCGQDTAGGVILGHGQSHVFVEGRLWSVLGDAVAGHGPVPHLAPVMAEGSSFITINGIPVCRQGHHASCGHAATGSTFMFIQD